MGNQTTRANIVEIILIAAMAANRVIGNNNRIPWHLPEELKRFKTVTWGHPLLMGRKTHESIGRPLPGRRNIVVTRNRKYQAPGCEVVHSLEQAYARCKDEAKVFNIGGEQLYRQGLDRADTLLLTVLQEPVAGDAYFPEIPPERFTLVGRQEVEAALPYSILTYRRSAMRVDQE